MTCFSIQKSFFLVLLLALFSAAPFVAAAQDHSRRAAGANIPMSPEEKKAERFVKVDSPIVIELFTASDCSACIFADRILYDAMKDKQVIALSCHIKDSTSMSDDGKEDGKVTDGPMDPCVFRHWTFAAGRSNEDVTLAIPAFYFNGQDFTQGEDMNVFNTTLHNYHYSYLNQSLEAMMRWKDKNTISIHLPQARKESGKVNASVWLVRYKDMAVERMDQGVNKGRVLRFSNIVQDITHIAKWHGNVRVIDVDVNPPQGGKERGGYVVLVAPMLGMPYMAAGKLVDYPVAADIEEEAEKRARAKAATEGKLQAVPAENMPANAVPEPR